MHPFERKNYFRKLTDNRAQQKHKMITECAKNREAKKQTWTG